MPTHEPIFVSTPVTSTAAPLEASWPPHPEAEAYIYCRLSVPLNVRGAAALLAGGLDLMMERYVVAKTETTVTERSVRAGHRMVVCRTAQRQLLPVAGLALAPTSDTSHASSLEALAAATTNWWSQPPGAHGSGARPPTTRARIEEPTANRAAPAFIERPMTVREGRALKEAKDATAQTKHASPSAAWESQVKPRMEKRRVTDAAAALTTPAATEADPSEEQSLPEPTPITEELPIHWVLIGSQTLVRCKELVPNLRKLRGYFRVGFTGLADRAWLQKHADHCDVPLDAIVAMTPEHPGLWHALGSPAGGIAVIVTTEDATSANTRRVETTPAQLTDTCDALIAERIEGD